MNHFSCLVALCQLNNNIFRYSILLMIIILFSLPFHFRTCLQSSVNPLLSIVIPTLITTNGPSFLSSNWYVPFLHIATSLKHFWGGTKFTVICVVNVVLPVFAHTIWEEMNTQKRILHLFSASIREGELHLFLAELSRILVVLIEGRGSALRSSRPVASDESGSRHLRVLSHNELERRRCRSHRVSSRHRVHLVTRSISKRTSDGTRSRIHVHSLGKIGTDGELTEIGVRTSRHRSTYWSSNRIHSSDTWEFQWYRYAADWRTPWNPQSMLGDRWSTHNAHRIGNSGIVLVRKTHRKLGLKRGYDGYRRCKWPAWWAGSPWRPGSNYHSPSRGDWQEQQSREHSSVGAYRNRKQ